MDLRSQIEVMKSELEMERKISKSLKFGYELSSDFGECFDQELNKMDAIYASLSRTLKGGY